MLDLIRDCTDNPKTRRLIDTDCLKHNRLLVRDAAVTWKEQLAVFNSSEPEIPSMNGRFGELEDTNPACVESGIVALIMGIIGIVKAMCNRWN